MQIYVRIKQSEVAVFGFTFDTHLIEWQMLFFALKVFYKLSDKDEFCEHWKGAKKMIFRFNTFHFAGFYNVIFIIPSFSQENYENWRSVDYFQVDY